jgi:hypothetical protein
LNQGETIIAVLLAAADFEWTLRRAILALGCTPNVDLREGILAKCTGLDRYKVAWRIEVARHRGTALPSVIPDWEKFKEAFKLRHRVIHGVDGFVSVPYAAERVNAILAATSAVAAYSNGQGADLYSRLPIRKRKKIQ